MGQGASRGAPSRDMALDMAALGAPQVVSGRDLGRDPGRGPRGPSHAWGAPSGDVPGGVPCGEPTGVSGAAAAAAHVLASLPAEARARALQRRAVETAGCSRDPSRERRPSTAAALPPPPFFFSSAGASRRASDGAGAAGWAGAATSGGSGGGAYRREARHRDWQRREGGTGPTIGTVHTVSGATVIAACGSSEEGPAVLHYDHLRPPRRSLTSLSLSRAAPLQVSVAPLDVALVTAAALCDEAGVLRAVVAGASGATTCAPGVKRALLLALFQV